MTDPTKHTDGVSEEEYVAREASSCADGPDPFEEGEDHDSSRREGNTSSGQ